MKHKANWKEWRWNIFSPTIFFGLYHWGDYVKFLMHKGKKSVFWCGSDIINLSQNNKVWIGVIMYHSIIKRVSHFCENKIEQEALKNIGIKAEIAPMIFDTIEQKESFISSRFPHVYMNCREGRELEYGLDIVQRISHKLPEITFHIYGLKKASFGSGGSNVIYHLDTSEDEFNKEIKNYQCGLRLNQFDGFSEITAKSILMGQYPITVIKYPLIDFAENENQLIQKLKDLKTKTVSNPDRESWINRLNNSLNVLLSF